MRLRPMTRCTPRGSSIAVFRFLGDATRPPGLMVGISALTPSANADHDQACTEDTVKLAASVRAVAGNGEVVFVASANQFERLYQRFGFPYPVLNSNALPDKTVICIAANCIASATDPRRASTFQIKGLSISTLRRSQSVSPATSWRA